MKGRKKLDSTKNFERDNLLIDFIYNHKGIENIVSGNEVCRYLQEKNHNINSQTLHLLITKIKFERHLPICSLNSKGYYWAKSKQDILSCIAHLQSRIDSLQEHIDHLKNFILD